MPGEIRVPTLGESVVEATIGRWLKRVGEPVKVGEPLVELETDKVNVEVSADFAGTLETHLKPEGEIVRPGDTIGMIGVNGSAGTTPSNGASAPAPAAATTPDAAPALTAAESEIRATPLAARVAGELGVNISEVPPTGPGHKVVRDDVQAFVQHPAAAPAAVAPTTAPAVAPAPVSDPLGRAEKRQKLSRRRLTIARRLVEAQHTAAMLTTFNEVDLSAVMAIRARRKEEFLKKHGVGLGFMSFFTKASIGALRAFPQINAELQGDELVLKEYFDIGIAIGDKEGLVVPVIRDADKLTFTGIEQAIQGYAQKSKDKALTVEDLRGGTFTITNGGVFGSLLSTPILNPPQVGILGMHKIQERPVAVGGEVVIRPIMYLALTYDHRVVDGREAVQFLVKIKELLEDPERLLLEG